MFYAKFSLQATLARKNYRHKLEFRLKMWLNVPLLAIDFCSFSSLFTLSRTQTLDINLLPIPMISLRIRRILLMEARNAGSMPNNIL